LIINTALRENDPVWFVAAIPLDSRFEYHPLLVGIAEPIEEADRNIAGSCIVELLDEYVLVVRVDEVDDRTALDSSGFMASNGLARPRGVEDLSMWIQHV
jgi:hypothetical protein